MTTKGIWPSGFTEEVAIIDITKFEIEKLCDCNMLRSYDDLDFFDFAILLASKEKFVLYRYDNSPFSGFVVVLDKKVNPSLDSRLHTILTHLGLDESKIKWLRE